MPYGSIWRTHLSAVWGKAQRTLRALKVTPPSGPEQFEWGAGAACTAPKQQGRPCFRGERWPVVESHTFAERNGLSSTGSM